MRSSIVTQRSCTATWSAAVGPDEADGLLGETFRIAFEKRGTYDLDLPNARPWLYGITTKLVAKYRRTEARRIRAVARLAGQRLASDNDTERVIDILDAAHRWQRVAEIITGLPEPERDALVLHVWEGIATTMWPMPWQSRSGRSGRGSIEPAVVFVNSRT